MYCGKCGNQVAEGAAFCPECGDRISADPICTQTADFSSKKKGKELIAAVVAVLVVVLAAVGLFALSEPKDPIVGEWESVEASLEDERVPAFGYMTVSCYEDGKCLVILKTDDGETSSSGVWKNTGYDEDFGDEWYEITLDDGTRFGGGAGEVNGTERLVLGLAEDEDNFMVAFEKV